MKQFCNVTRQGPSRRNWQVGEVRRVRYKVLRNQY